METRFGVKDFFLFTVLGGLIVLIVMAMIQYDRQWDDIQDIKYKLDRQAADLQSMQQQLARGVPVGTTQATASGNAPPSMQRIAQSRSMPGFAEGDWLVTGLSGKFSTLTPIVSSDAYASEVQSNVIETLCMRDPVSLEWQGLLAESWKMQDNSAEWDKYAATRRSVPLTRDEVLGEPGIPSDDQKEEREAYITRRLAEGRNDDNIGSEPQCPPAAIITVKLREGPQFSDGTPVTAEDVVFTFQFIMNPQIDAPRHRAYLGRIKEVKKTGDREVTFLFRTPYFEALELVAGFEVLPQKFYQRFKPEEFNRSTGLLMGSGPYMMENPESWKPGQPVQLIRNPRYWSVQSGFSKLVYREFTSAVALETAFRNGEIDSFAARPEQYLAMKDDPKLKERTQSFEYQSAVGGYRYVAWNQFRYGKNTKFADKRVRHAMTLLTDQKRLVAEIMLNMAVPATGPFNPQSQQNDANLKPHPFDVERAAKLLEEAGWRDRDGRGVLTNDAGEEFEFKLTYPSGNPNYEKMALLLRDLYARAKVRLVPDAQEWSVFRDRLKNKEFDAITLGWTAGIEGDIFQMFHSSQSVASGDNFMSYRNPELDRVIEAARRTLDKPKRMELWHKAHQILYEDQPYTFLFFGKSLILLDNRIANVQVLPLGLNSDREWFVEKQKQRWTK